MKLRRPIGLLLLACSALCFVIATDTYLTDVRTGKAVMAALKGVKFESVPIPIETTVCGLVGIAMLVAGVRLLFESFRRSKAKDGLLKSD